MPFRPHGLLLNMWYFLMIVKEFLKIPPKF